MDFKQNMQTGRDISLNKVDESSLEVLIIQVIIPQSIITADKIGHCH